MEVRHVRNTARLVASSLVGRELASPLRRAGALLVDALLLVVLLLPLLIVVGVTATAVQVGGFDVLAALSDESDGSPANLERREQARTAMVTLLAERRPSLVPTPVKAALESGDREALERALEGVELSLSVQLSSGRVESSWNEETGEVEIANDVIFGRVSRYLTIMFVFVAWFTVLTALWDGRTPGKWLFGLRVVRADGKPLGWWRAFSRAGGYLGSFGTFGVGFAEALWDANRQAAHDRQADTFVIRSPRRSSAASGDDAR